MEDPDGRRQELRGLLGDLPARDRPVPFETVAVEDRQGYALEKLRLDLNGLEVVPAYFVRPPGAMQQRPTILYNHAHGGDYALGKDELIRGREALQDPPYAAPLVQCGWNVLCIDHWAFGERRGRTESETFKEMLWRGRVMWGMMVFDSIRAVDYLLEREDVDGTRIATTGISMGSTMAWWTAALDIRIKVCVDLCCMTDFESLVESGGLDGHGIYYYVPRLLRHFTTAEINELIAPRPHLCLAGNHDALTPRGGLERIDTDMKAAYVEGGAPEAWQMVRYETGHFENADMRRRVLEFLEKWL